jgi:hypothetical protein
LFTVDRDTPTRFSQEYHPDYNWTVHGKDTGVQFEQPVPQRLAVPDWYNEINARAPGKTHGNAWFSYMKDPQIITEDMLTKMQKEGYAPGGKVVRSGLSELMELIKQRGGSEAAKRLERAADSVPNLEHQFQPQSLKSAFTGDNATALMVMNPKDFKKYATPLPEIHTDFGNFNIADKSEKGNYQDYLDYLGRITKKGGLEDVPYLQLNLEQNRTFPNVTGHEGRNRSEALAKLGDQTSLVRMLPRANLREAFPRRSQEEYLEALINKIGNKPMVTPQPDFDPVKGVDIPRGLIQLPELFKKGGKVKKKK